MRYESKHPFSAKGIKDMLTDFFERTRPESTLENINDRLSRIESKLDQLLTPVQAELPCEEIVEFKLGDKVRVKSWKEIKRLTTKGNYGNRVFNDRSYLARTERNACGKRGVIIKLKPGNEYIAVKSSNWEYLLPPQALEKIQP